VAGRKHTFAVHVGGLHPNRIVGGTHNLLHALVTL
jgi:hypothetical protein